jgi:phosphoribosylformylglycinamidine cyclo-ligase
MAVDYKDSGVDVERGYEAVRLMKKYVAETYDKNVVGDIGLFGGFYALDDKADGDVLVAGTDGVGTKLKYAFTMNKHDSIGIDCVAMCVNDVVCQGARPLIFLDYIALPRLEPEKVASLVKGVAEGCMQAGCSLIGGETAEMPGFYSKDEYDIAGFAVGIAKKNKIINGSGTIKGDLLIGLASSGIHSNGYSLVRQLFKPDLSEMEKYDEDLKDKPINVVLTPTRIYVKSILKIIDKYTVKGIAHITGGGFIENIPRIIPNGLGIKIKKDSYPIPQIFKALAKKSGADERKLYNTFNMGIGMVLCVDKKIAKDVINYANSIGEKAYLIGEVTDKEGVELC